MHRVPSGRTIRAQISIDLGVSLVLCMLIWPFPLARASLTVVSHVLSILLAWGVIHVAYLAATVGAWSQTAAMRLLGLSLATLDGQPCHTRQRMRWGVIAGTLVLLRLVDPSGRPGRPALVDRISGARLLGE